MIFPYIEFLGLQEERIFRPMIPVTFKSNNYIFKSYALVDSGSDYTILPIEIANRLNIKLSSTNRYTIEGAGGSTFSIYQSPIEIEHIIHQKGFREIKISSKVFFAESGSTLLLGQKGFLEHIKANLKGNQREIEIIQNK